MDDGDEDVHGHNPLNNPLATFRLDNTVETKWCEISLNMSCVTSGADQNYYMRKPYFQADLSLYKSFLGDKLSLQLYASDLLKTGKRCLRHYFGSLRELTYDTPALRVVNLTVRYKFNMGRSKYKGTGAGEGQKSRF